MRRFFSLLFRKNQKPAGSHEKIIPTAFGQPLTDKSQLAARSHAFKEGLKRKIADVLARDKEHEQLARRIEQLPEEQQKIAINLLDTDKSTQRIAVYNLKERFPKSRILVEIFELLLEEKYAETRDVAIHALTDIKATESVRLIERRLVDIRPEVRRAAVEALGALGAKGSEIALAERLEDVDSFVREYAIRALVKLEAIHALPDLVKLCKKERTTFVLQAGIEAVAHLEALKLHRSRKGNPDIIKVVGISENFAIEQAQKAAEFLEQFETPNYMTDVNKTAKQARIKLLYELQHES